MILPVLRIAGMTACQGLHGAAKGGDPGRRGAGRCVGLDPAVRTAGEGSTGRCDSSPPRGTARLAKPVAACRADEQTRHERALNGRGSAVHDDFYLELARLRWQDLQREIERDRAVKMARSVLPPRQPWVWSLLGRAFSAMQPVVSRFLSSGIPGVTGRSRGGGRSSASDAQAPSAAPRGHHAVDAALPPCQRQKRPAAGTVMRHGRRIAA
jgi:hypothetical protein